MSKVSKAKSILFALITPVLIQGCNTTSYQEQNTQVTTNLTPLASYFKDYLFNDCNEEQITLDNYQEILEKKESKAYGSPYNQDECIPISFNVHEPESFYEDMLDSALDKDKAKELLASIQSSEDDTKQVIKFDLKDGRLAQIVRYTPELEKNIQGKRAWRNRDIILDNYDDYFFLHELFHTTDINADRSIPQNTKETLSDIATVIALSTTKEFTIDKSVDLMKEVIHARLAESETPYGSGWSTHFQSDMLYRFLTHLEKMEDKNEPLRAKSLGDAAKKARDIAFRQNEIKRDGTLARFYWTEKDEQIKNSRVFDRSESTKDKFIDKHIKKEDTITLSAN